MAKGKARSVGNSAGSTVAKVVGNVNSWPECFGIASSSPTTRAVFTSGRPQSSEAVPSRSICFGPFISSQWKQRYERSEHKQWNYRSQSNLSFSWKASRMQCNYNSRYGALRTWRARRTRRPIRLRGTGRGIYKQ